MKLLIEIPNKEYCKEDRDELAKMFMLLCDNIGALGLPCRRTR